MGYVCHHPALTRTVPPFHASRDLADPPGSRLEGIKVTLPTITKAMGFSNTSAQLMSCAALRRSRNRRSPIRPSVGPTAPTSPFVLAGLAMAAVALTTINATGADVADHVALLMSSVVLAFTGFSPMLPLMASWVAGNLAPAGRKAAGLALVNTLAGLSGIAGSFLFQGWDGDLPSQLRHRTGSSALGNGYGVASGLGIPTSESGERASERGRAEDPVR